MAKFSSRIPLPVASQFPRGAANAFPLRHLDRPVVSVSLGFLDQAVPHYGHDIAVPALVDTGFNGIFCINEEHLQRWYWKTWNRDVIAYLSLRARKDAPRLAQIDRGLALRINANLFLWNIFSETGLTSAAHKWSCLELDSHMLVLLTPDQALIDHTAFGWKDDEKKRIAAAITLPDRRPQLPLLGFGAIRRSRWKMSSNGEHIAIQTLR